MPLVLSQALNAFLTCVVLIILLQKHAVRLGLVDVPSGRKMHDGAIPVIGGVAIFGGVLAAMLLDPAMRGLWELIVGLALLVAVGVLDDRYDLRPLIKLVVQIVAALVMILPSWHVLDHIGDDGVPLRLGWLALPFTVAFVVGLINAFNMIDGVDGLAGGVALSVFIWLALAASWLLGAGEATVLLVLIAATVGFLLFNMRHPWQPRARIFMGDAGSMAMGAATAFFILRLSYGTQAQIPFIALFWLVAIPAIDTVSLMIRRVAAGRSPFSPDRQHLHHLLLDAGLKSGDVSLGIVVANLAAGGIGLGLHAAGAPVLLQLAGLIALAAGHTAFVIRSQRRSTRPAPSVSVSVADLGRAGQVRP